MEDTKTTELAKRGAASPALVEVRELAKELQTSGLFPGITTQGQAVAKILMGQELGIGPVTALQLIDVVKGRLRPRAQLIATLLKRSGRYDYTIARSDDKECSVVFSDRGKAVFTSTWTMEDARKAGVVKPDSGWTTYPREMLFARALSTGATKVCPEVLAGYEPLEGNGFEVVEGEVVSEGDPPASAWASFWAKATELGYATEEAVHDVLGVASLKDWLAQGKDLLAALVVLREAKTKSQEELFPKEVIKDGPKASQPPIDQALRDATLREIRDQIKGLAKGPIPTEESVLGWWGGHKWGYSIPLVQIIGNGPIPVEAQPEHLGAFRDELRKFQAQHPVEPKVV